MDKRGKASRGIKRSAFAVVGLLVCLAASTFGDELPASARTFIKTQCADCHDADSKKGNLDLMTLPTQLDDPRSERAGFWFTTACSAGKCRRQRKWISFRRLLIGRHF